MAKDLTSPPRTDRGRFARKEPLPFTVDELRAGIRMAMEHKDRCEATADLLDGIDSDWFDEDTVALARMSAKWLREVVVKAPVQP